MTADLIIERVDWTHAREPLQMIRHQVFVEEQGVSNQDEWDGQDEPAVHFLARQAGQPVGCARLQPDGKIQRMAVLATARGRGIGAALLSRVVAFAKRRGDDSIYLDAQLPALAFYGRLGFEPAGEVFQDAGIPHRRMYWRPDAVVKLSGPHACLQALRETVSLGRQNLDILTHQLTPGLFADEHLVASISRLARTSRRSRIRILVRDTRPLRARPHPLVDLTQRLPSRMALRTLHEIPQDSGASYLIADREALVYFNDEGEFTGFRRASGRAEAQQLLEQFGHLWQYHSFEDPNLKRLAL